MNCPKCGAHQADGRPDCIKCGIYFAKFERAQQRRTQQARPAEVSLIWQLHNGSDPTFRVMRGLLMLGLVWMSWGLMFSPIDYWQGNVAARSFLHNINLPFHEAGHLVFRPFGSLMGSLGGTLGQLLMPLVCFGVLLWKTRDAFGASVCMWWFGESFLDIVAYINDARFLSMPLVGGNEGRSSPYGFHDWEYILTETGLINHASELAKAAHIVGCMLIGIAILWMLLLVLRKSHQ